ncbi:hypothetical protein QFC19_006308 [Naganishia cerealis]|uniref:Uncharacterized protein n=1 Tax=Naganishia cerealis TaxID=610337 RepID=A0ACC2VHG7_9TREE|nr:hypothetical protein QFC19_006308 [Naganishia cerealis]
MNPKNKRASNATTGIIPGSGSIPERPPPPTCVPDSATTPDQSMMSQNTVYASSEHPKVLADLSASGRRLVDYRSSPRGAFITNSVSHADIDIPSEPNMERSVMAMQEQDHAVLLDLASSQGNSGVLSIIPPTFGPDDVLFGGVMTTPNLNPEILSKGTGVAINESGSANSNTSISTEACCPP